MLPPPFVKMHLVLGRSCPLVGNRGRLSDDHLFGDIRDDQLVAQRVCLVSVSLNSESALQLPESGFDRNASCKIGDQAVQKLCPVLSWVKELDDAFTEFCSCAGNTTCCPIILLRLCGCRKHKLW